jgi:prephenate dehydrogenase
MLGLGLIGGSVARAAARAGMEVRAWTPAGTGPREAAADGIAAAPSLSAVIAEADLVVIAAPPLASLALVDELAGVPALSADAVVTDVVSTKVAIVERARAAGLRFVGGHPLAGRETSGYGGSDPDLFRDRPWVVVPPEPADDAAEARVAALADACGARLIRMSAGDHDRAVATISHLPLLLAAALAETGATGSDWAAARELAAGGWASMTRLARGDPEMGAGILATNAREVADRLGALVVTLDGWAADLTGPNPAQHLKARLEGARATVADGPVDP